MNGRVILSKIIMAIFGCGGFGGRGGLVMVRGVRLGLCGRVCGLGSWSWLLTLIIIYLGFGIVRLAHPSFTILLLLSFTMLLLFTSRLRLNDSSLDYANSF
jgi:hypothetical protein